MKTARASQVARLLAQCQRKQAGSEFLLLETPSKPTRDALLQAGWEQVGQTQHLWAGTSIHQRYQLRIKNPSLASV